MLTEEKLIRLRNHDWHSTIRDGTRAVKDRTGLNYQQLWNAQKHACSDIWEKILQLSKLGG